MALSDNWDLYGLATATVVLYVAYWLAIFAYRVTLHPLAHFPGPRLAGMTFWYEFYYDMWPHSHRYTWRIKELHKQYGPIIRINPIHLHVNDPSYYDEIYAGAGRKRDKCPWTFPMKEPDVFSRSTFTTYKHDKHRLRRAPIGPFFSKQSIRTLEPLIAGKMNRFMERLQQHYLDGSVVNLSYAYAGLTIDVISAYCFGTGFDALELPEYGRQYQEIMQQGSFSGPLQRHWPIFNYMMKLPPWVIEKMDPKTAPLIRINEIILRLIKSILNEKHNESGQRTIFHELKDSNMPQAEKDPLRLMDEAQVLVGAGQETTARTLSVISFYLISRSDIRNRLKEELKAAFPNSSDMTVASPKLEQLPYLTACINEGLRLAHSVPGRLPRIAPEEDLHYGQWTIPRGTAIMQSSYIVHTNPDIFPDPEDYQPQRWIDNPKLTQHLVAFSKGSRSCVGMNLALAELYLTIAKVFRRFDFELHDTDEKRDVALAHDCTIAMVEYGSVGVRARIVGCSDD